MKCLIIAAGRGSRLLKKGDSKPLVPLLGLPLIERTILTARKGWNCPTKLDGKLSYKTAVIYY